MRVVVLLSVEGNIESKEIVEGEVDKIVKDVATKALSMWDPSSSDFTVIRSYLELRYKLPINPELYDKLLELNLEVEKIGNTEIAVKLPVYTISFDNQWLEDAYIDRRMYIVAPVLDDESLDQLIEYAKDATRGPKKVGEAAESISLDEDALRRLEEGLTEAEETEKTRSRSRKKTRKKR